MEKDWITIEGKNISEAKQKAAEMLKTDLDNIKFVSIQKESSGLMGVGSRNSILRAKIKEVSNAEAKEEQKKEDTKISLGLVGVKDGELVSEIPEGSQPPVIIPGKNIVILLDGEKQEGSVNVECGQHVEAVLLNKEAYTEIEVMVNDDSMDAKLKVSRVAGKQYGLEELPLTPRLRLSAKLIKEIPAPEPSMDEIMQKIAEKGISFGIDKKAIERALKTEQLEVIARGKKPLPGEDAYLEKCFQEEIISEGSGKVRLVNIKEVAVVEPGQVLVIKHPAQEGLPGQDVLGREVSPPPVKDVFLKAGTGAELIEDARQAAANITGRPALEGETVVAYKGYNVEGDVDAKTGHIHFKGDVFIKGDVKENMEVEAHGRVVVEGGAFHSKIRAGRELILQNNAVGATIQSGGTSLICGRAAAATELLEAKITELENAFEQLGKSDVLQQKMVAGEAGIVLKNLLETKFSDLSSAIKEWQAETENVTMVMNDKEMEEMHNFFEVLLGRGPLELRTSNKWEEFFQEAGLVLSVFKESMIEFAEVKADLTVAYAQDSGLGASGKVLVNGRGCFHCRIFAGQGVLINGIPGVFRGGEVRAGGDVHIKELGSVAETETKVTVAKGHKISSEKVHPGVVLTAGVRVKHVHGITHKLEFGE